MAFKETDFINILVLSNDSNIRDDNLLVTLSPWWRNSGRTH